MALSFRVHPGRGTTWTLMLRSTPGGAPSSAAYRPQVSDRRTRNGKPFALAQPRSPAWDGASMILNVRSPNQRQSVGSS
jgi:hypothetical protein